MARFVIASRRAGKFTADEKARARAAIDAAFRRDLARKVDVVGDFAPDDEQARRVVLFEAAEDEIRTLQEKMPEDVILEPEIAYEPLTAKLPLDLAGALAVERKSTPAGRPHEQRLTARGDGQPQAGVAGTLVLHSNGSACMSCSTTGANGKATFLYDGSMSPSAMVVTPADAFWSTMVPGPETPALEVDLTALPYDGPLAWWHEKLGIHHFDPGLGHGIRVGMCDTGVGPNPALDHVHDVGAFIGGAHLASPGEGADIESHGTAVAGILGARPHEPGAYAGIAPGAELFAARVFSLATSAAQCEMAGAESCVATANNQGDIANAIDYLSSVKRVDLLNLSFGGLKASEIFHDAILDAFERGTLCLCAAGNYGKKPVLYPARFPKTVAVSSVGLEGWAPPGSLASTFHPEDPEKHGAEDLYLATFSNFGPQIDTTTPGVGIISTVPARFGLTEPYADMSGTSLSSPAACGALAAILASDPGYRGLPRDQTRAEAALERLNRSCRTIDLAEIYQGRGVPTIDG